MKKATVLTATAITSMVLLGGLGAKQVEAFWPFDGLSKSNNNQAVTDFRTERRSTMEAQLETRLNEAVAAGKLTEAQKTLILQKHEELQATQNQDFQNRQNHRVELEKWATDNGIDMSFFGGFGNGNSRGGMMGAGRGMGRGMHR